MADSIDRGVLLLRNAARSMPDDPKVCSDLIAALCRKGLRREPVEEFVAFVKHNPEATQLHHDMLLQISRHMGLANPLFQAFHQAANGGAKEDIHLVQYGFGLLHAALGMHDKAIAPYQESIRSNPDYAPAYHNLGLSLRFSADLKGEKEQIELTQQAIEACLTATQKSPTLAEPHYFLAVMAMNNGDQMTAILHFVEFVRLAKPYLANYVPRAKLSIQVLRERLRESSQA